MKIGGNDIKLMIGDQDVNSAYLGSVLVYSKSRLPQGYTELEYIENQSDAYIATGVNANITSTIRVKAMWSGNSAGVILCTTRSGSNGPRLSLGNSAIYISSTTTDNQTFQFALSSNKVYEVEYNNGTITYKNLTTGTTSSFTFSGTGTGDVWVDFNLFRQAYGSAFPFIGRIYEFELSNGTEEMHLVPCISNTNVVGMYNIIGRRFYQSPNNTPFIAGTIVSE